MSKIKFVCPKCNQKTFKVNIEIKTLDDFYGAVCTGCNYTITEDDIKKQAMSIAENLAKKAFKDVKKRINIKFKL